MRAFRAPARVTFGRSPKSDQKVCLKPKVSRLPARYTLFPIVGLYRTVTKLFICRAVKRIVSAPAPLPLISATVEVGAPIFQSKSGSEKRSSGVISRPPLGGGWQREALAGGEKTAYYVSPSVKTEGFDTSLTEGGKDAPAGAAGRCGHRPLRTGTRSAIVQRLSLRHGFAVPPPSQREAKGNDSKTVGTHNLYKRNKEERLCLHPELLPSSFSWS